MLEIDKIYQVDCLDGMSKIDDKSVSLILTDPPYEISRNSNYAKSAPTGKDTDRFRISIDFGDWDKQKAFDIGSMIKESYRCLKDGVGSGNGISEKTLLSAIEIVSKQK